MQAHNALPGSLHCMPAPGAVADNRLGHARRGATDCVAAGALPAVTILHDSQLSRSDCPLPLHISTAGLLLDL